MAKQAANATPKPATKAAETKATAKPKPKLSVVGEKSTPPKDHNSEVSEDQITAFHLAKLKKAQAESKNGQSELKAVQNTLGASGMNVAAASKALKIIEKGKKQETVDWITAVLKYLRILGDPIVSDQLEMFESVPVKPGILEQAFEDGLRAGIEGADRNSSHHDLNSDSGREWVKGFDQGAENRKRILKMKPDEKLVKDTTDQAGKDAVEAEIMGT